MMIPLVAVRNPLALGLSLRQDAESLRFENGATAEGDVSLDLPITFSSDGTTPDEGWWYAARVDNVFGKQPSFEIDFTDYKEPQEVNGQVHNAWWAYEADTDDWKLFDNESYDGNLLTVSNDAPFTEGTIYVAHYPIYPYSRVRRKLQEWIDTGLLQPTASGAGSGNELEPYVIGTQTARTDPVDSRSIPALDAYSALMHGTGDNRNALMMSVGVHANETLAYWVYQGAVDYLLTSGEAAAQGLREWWDVYLYPTIDPQQLWAGYFRSTPEDLTLQMNREWDTANVEAYTIHRSAWSNDLPALDAIIDHHCYNNTAAGANFGFGLFYTDGSTIASDFVTAMQVYETDVDKVTSTGSQNLRLYTQDEHGKATCLALTMEAPPRSTHDSVQDYLDWGANQMRALWDRTAAGDYTYGP